MTRTTRMGSLLGLAAFTLALAGSAHAEQARQAATPASHPPVDAIGTIASVDQQAGTVTLNDGRTFKITKQTTFWQRSQPDLLRPGAQVFIDDAQPIAFREQGKDERKADGSMRMGTVAFVDPQHNLIVLTDGTRVRMGPTAVIRFNGQPVAVTELTPGSEIVVRVRPLEAQAQPAASPATTGPTADRSTTPPRAESPSTSVSPSEFEGDELHLMRKPQAP